MSFKLADVTIPTGAANSTRRLDVAPENVDAFLANLETQFPTLKPSNPPVYAQFYASMHDPKGNATVWQQRKGSHTVLLTGACTAFKAE